MTPLERLLLVSMIVGALLWFLVPAKAQGPLYVRVFPATPQVTIDALTTCGFIPIQADALTITCARRQLAGLDTGGKCNP